MKKSRIIALSAISAVLLMSCGLKKPTTPTGPAFTITGATENDKVTFDETSNTYTLESDSAEPKFTLKGELKEGQIITKTKDTVLKLSNVTITNKVGEPAIYGDAKFELSTESDTENFISSSGTNEGSTAAVYSEKGLEIGGSGKLTIEGGVTHGVKATKIKVKGSGEISIKGTSDGSAINCNSFTVDADKTFTLTLSDSKNGIKADETIDIASGTFYLTNLTTGLKTDKAKDDPADAPKEHHINVTGGKIYISNVEKTTNTEKGKDTIADGVIQDAE